jgi:hypothetical protein
VQKVRAYIGLVLVVWVPISIWLFLSLNAKINRIDIAAGQAFRYQLDKIDSLHIQDSLINNHLAMYDELIFPAEDPTIAESMYNMQERFRKEAIGE